MKIFKKILTLIPLFLVSSISIAESKSEAPQLLASWDVSADEQLTEQLLVKLEKETHPRPKLVFRVYQVSAKETHLLREEKATSEITSKGKKAFRSSSILVEDPELASATIRFSNDVSSITGQTQLLARGIYDLRSVVKMKANFAAVADLK